MEIQCKSYNNYVLQIFSNWQWVPEIRLHKAGTPFLLVGTEIELRNDEHVIEKLAENNYEFITSPITTEQGDSLAKQLKAVKYVECSVMTQVSYQIVYAYNVQL